MRWGLVVDSGKAFVGLRLSFSAHVRWGEHGAPVLRSGWDCLYLVLFCDLDLRVWRCGIPHLAKNERDAPNFLHSALDKTACAPFFKERRMKCGEATKPYRKSGMW